MSVVMSSREASGVGPMAEKEAAIMPAGATCGVKRGFSVGRGVLVAEVSSESSSSIGEAEEESSLSVSTSSAAAGRRGGGEEGEEEEVQSRWSKEASLGSLESLEEALPIKRGLSCFFTGKSKSFASLADAAAAGTARELAKPEHAFNKRRRILVSCRPSWRRRASCASLLSSCSSAATLSSSSSPSVPTASTPDLSSLGSEGEGEEEEGGAYGEAEDEEGRSNSESADTLYPIQPPVLHRFNGGGSINRSKMVTGGGAFRSPRSFSLCDLRQHARK